MKRLAEIALLMLIAFYSCRNESKKTGSEQNTSKSSQVKKEKVLILPWNASLNSETQHLELKYDPATDMSQFTMQDMIDALNLKYPEIPLKLDGMKKDTMQVSISNADFLTEQLGSTGAEVYLAEATFALTELKGVHVVYFSFKEGDHAGPRAYSRKDFQGFN